MLTNAHATPYTQQCLKQGSEVTISKQALISFLVGTYCGEVLCDVRPMDACHILLGRPCLFDNHVMHDGLVNTNALKFKGRNIISTLLRPPKPLKFEQGMGITKAYT